MTDGREQRARGPAWLRRILGHPRLVPLTALMLRARTVRPAPAFVARELLGRGGVFAYAVRSGGVRVLVRHGSADPVTLGEVFHECDYLPPAGAVVEPPERVVDLGANVGYFGAFAMGQWPQASVVAFEPDPENAALHERTISLNGLGDRWHLERAAATSRAGELRFHATGDALAHADEDGDVVVAAMDVLPLIAKADILKMDIEGGEWEILEDQRFAASPPRVVVLEHHPRGSLESDPRGAVLHLLADAGLTQVATIFRREDGHGMLWAWRA